MEIDRNTPICGILPARLKKLFRRSRITITTTMSALGMNRLSATTTLAALEGEAWLKRVEYEWELTDLALRLMATPLHPRRTVQSAKDVLDRLMEEVRAINGDPSHSYWVESVVLFGSMLTADGDDTVGDVDISVQLRRRPEDEAALSAELASAPSSYRGVMLQMWPYDRVLRRIRRVDRCVSLHPLEDALKFEGREIYRFGSAAAAEE